MHTYYFCVYQSSEEYTIACIFKVQVTWSQPRRVRQAAVTLSTYQNTSCHKVKANFTLEQALNTQRGSRFIALLFLQPLPLTTYISLRPGKRVGTHYTDRRMGTRAGLDGCRIFRPHRNSIPRLRRSSSELLYQLYYPSPHKSQLRLKITFTDRMIIQVFCLSIAVCKRRISERHFVVTNYSYAVSCQITQAVIRISPPLLIGRATFKSVVDNTYAFTIHLLYIVYTECSIYLFSLFISSYMHFMNPVNLCWHRRGLHIAWCVATSFVTFFLVSIMLKRRRH